MRKPIIFIIIPIILGIYIANSIDIEISHTLFLLAILAIPLICSFIFNKGFKFWLLIAMITIGALLVNWQYSRSSIIQHTNKYVDLEGIVDRQIGVKDNYSKYTIKVVHIKSKDKIYETTDKIVLGVTGNIDLLEGDKIRARGILKEPRQNSNPMLFDYKQYLYSNKIYGTMTVSAGTIIVEERKERNNIEIVKSNILAGVTSTLDSILNKGNSAIMKSILLGDDSFLDAETEDKFRNLGISHILAVSGLHIGIIYALLIFIFRIIRLSSRSASLAAILAIWIYGYIINYPISVLRASIMFTFLVVGKMIHRRYDPINILAFAALILILANPLTIYNMGFQLSFLATASLLILNNKIYNYLPFRNKKISKVLSPIISVQIGILPISIYYFNYLPLTALVGNILIIPILSLCLILSIIAVVIFTIGPVISYFIGLFIDSVLIVTKLLIDKLNTIIFLNIGLPSPDFIEIILYFIAVFIAFRIMDIRKLGVNIVKAASIYVLLLIIIVNVSFIIRNEVSIVFIDVGQGDCSLLRIKGQNFLIDTGGSAIGNYDVGKEIVLPYLKKAGINKLDGIFVTHFHDDHSEGFFSLAEDIAIDRVFIGYEAKDNPLYLDLINEAYKRNISIKKLTKGDKIIINEEMNISVLNPESKESSIYWSENNMSMVLLFDAYGRRILFTGDIEKNIESDIIKRVSQTKVDIIKVPHHGSSTSSSKELLEHFSPDYGVIQVGNNNYGHPDKGVLDNYLQREIKIYRNDLDGLVKVSITKDSLQIYPFLGDTHTVVKTIEDNWHTFLYYFIITNIWIAIVLRYNKYYTKLESKIDLIYFK